MFWFLALVILFIENILNPNEIEKYLIALQLIDHYFF